MATELTATDLFHFAVNGVTYREDHDSVSASLEKLKADGIYPQRLNDTRG